MVDRRHLLPLATFLLLTPSVLVVHGCLLPADPPWWSDDDDAWVPGDDDDASDDDSEPCSTGHPVQEECGPIGYEGCCDGPDLYWCRGGWVCTLDCSSNPSCGWNPDGLYYDCETEGLEAPGGVPSLECGVWR
jgi:hypothetical protein